MLLFVCIALVVSLMKILYEAKLEFTVTPHRQAGTDDEVASLTFKLHLHRIERRGRSFDFGGAVFESGKMVAILGKSGAGKSTLMSGLTNPMSKCIQLECDEQRRDEFRVAYLSQVERCHPAMMMMMTPTMTSS